MPYWNWERTIPLLMMVMLAGGVIPTGFADTSKLNLATATEIEPYVFRQTAGTFAGIDYDLVERVFESARIEFQLKSYPPPRIKLMLERAQLDGLLTTTHFNDDAVLSTMWLSEPLYSSNVVAFALTDTPGSDSFLEVCSRIGVLSGFNYHFPNLDLSRFNHIMKVNRTKQLVELLIHQRIDCALSEDITFIYQARRLNHFKDIKILKELANQSISIALSKSVMKNHTELGERLNSIITNIKNKEIVYDIIIKYLKTERN